jgi:predicted aldo/keto reductase-like oxidoreductase
MQYRTFGKLAWRPSALGFGAMRLPTIGGDPAQIDEPEATRMLRHAIDHGVNYVDTAYPYHRSTSEPFLGRALGDGYRGRVKLATKLPSWLVKEAADFDRFLNEQLARLQTATIDFYLLHALDAERWPKLRDLGVLAWAERALAAGRIGHLGFSFHDKYEVFQEIVDAYDGWTLCQIQYNYMDEQEQAGVRGLSYAAAKGLAVIVMEPLRGGQLAGNAPPPVQAIWDTAAVARSGDRPPRTPAEWALQWVWNQPEVSLLLSGMSTMEQVTQNLASAERSGPGALSVDELALIRRVREKYLELCPIPCTGCKYCQPCPNGVTIPRIFGTYNEAVMYGNTERGRMIYRQWFKAEEKADRCLRCGECEAQCPQRIMIMDWLEKAHELLTAA